MYLGSHPAIDLLNTAFAPDGERFETIGDGRTFMEWLVGAGLLDAAVATGLSRHLGEKALDATAAEARKVREWARSWLTRWRAAPRRDYSDEITTLNKLLAREARYRKVVAAGRALDVVERSRIDDAPALLAVVAGSIASLVSEEDAALVRSCAGAGCTLWFLDRSRAHRRAFCSASVCGNRAKVAAFRARASRSDAK
ncbi:MAG: CGNR zinc finger domain-containing protein [Steroidobacteraceae bacterium]